MIFLRQYFEIQEQEIENLYLTWEVIAGVHGVELKIPYLQQKREELRCKERAKRPIPLHLQFLNMGVQVKSQ